MIPRYTREKMAAIWSPENRYRKWLDVELLAAGSPVALLADDVPNTGSVTVHLPAGIVDRRFRPRIAELPREGVVTIEARVVKHRPPPPQWPPGPNIAGASPAS